MRAACAAFVNRVATLGAALCHNRDRAYPPVDAYHHHAQRKHVHSPTYEAVTKPVYSSSIGRWRNYAAQLEPHRDILRPFIDAFGYSP